jgi:hypothetical protein
MSVIPEGRPDRTLTASSGSEIVSFIESARRRWRANVPGLFLPGLSAASFVSGGAALAFRSGPAFDLAGVTLLSVGVGSLLRSVASRLGQPIASLPVPEGERDSTVAEGALCAQCASPIAPLNWEGRFVGRFDPTVGAAGDSVRVLFTPTSAADQLWVHWLPAEVGQLPSELIGPIAESAHFPEAPPGVGPLREGLAEELTVADPPAAIEFSNPVSPGTLTPFGELTGPIPWETSARISPSLDILPAPGPSPPHPKPPRVTPAPTSAEPPLWMREILAEAMNPIPPHLRPELPPPLQSRSETPRVPGFEMSPVRC